MLVNVLPADVGNRITELSKVITRLHAEMKQINSSLVDYSGNTSGNPPANPSEGSSFLGKYIVGAKNNFKGFSNERKPAPLITPVHHEEPEEEPEETGRDGENTDIQESPACDTETEKESNEEQTSEGGIDNVIEEHTVDIDETDGDDEDVQTSAENNTDSEQTEDKNETVIDIETNTDTESERDSRGADETEMMEEATDETHEPSETADVNESEENEEQIVSETGTEMQENEDGEGNDGGSEDANDGSQGEGSEESEEMSIDKGSLVSFLAKRIEEKLEMKDMKFIFSGKQASSPTGSDVSHDTGFGSQFDLSANSPE